MELFNNICGEKGEEREKAVEKRDRSEREIML